MDFSARSYNTELLDRDDIPFSDIEQNMRELNIINTWLGGHRVTLHGVGKLIGNKKEITVCEIGCGGGDNLLAIHDWCKKKNIRAKLIGIDINPDCIKVANAKSNNPDAAFLTSDYRSADFGNQKPGIIFSSLFCHHFTNQELIGMLQWMKSNATVGFFVNDLHRYPLAYYSIKWITKIFSRSYLVKNDAPLSVLRGFKKNEWKLLLHLACIDHYELHWKWAFRWLIIFENKK
jgi:2-polyprenyl-3-methyl-5-hydroxy-6-metoxy-1,4-benzoquinol methylase